MFSRLASIGRSEKINDIEMKNAFVKSSLTWWANDFKNDFVPPPPRPPFLEGKRKTQVLPELNDISSVLLL